MDASAQTLPFTSMNRLVHESLPAAPFLNHLHRTAQLAPGLHLSSHRNQRTAHKEGTTMKTTTTRIMIGAALLALASGIASAQTLKADIPFAFRVGSKVMAAGTYRVTINGPQRNMVTLSNFEAKDSAILLPYAPADPPKEWRVAGNPLLTFECGTSRCELSNIWAGPSYPALAIPHRALGPEEHASLTEIKLVRATD
jgi:hypothetical protein